MAAECELGGCGVLAIGRCNRCGHAFCESHRAFDERGRYLVDQCVTCRELAVEERQRKLTGSSSGKVTVTSPELLPSHRAAAARTSPTTNSAVPMTRSLLEDWLRSPRSPAPFVWSACAASDFGRAVVRAMKKKGNKGWAYLNGRPKRRGWGIGQTHFVTRRGVVIEVDHAAGELGYRAKRVVPRHEELPPTVIRNGVQTNADWGRHIENPGHR